MGTWVWESRPTTLFGLIRPPTPRMAVNPVRLRGLEGPNGLHRGSTGKIGSRAVRKMPYKRILGLKTLPHCRHYPPVPTQLALAGRYSVCLRNGCFYLTARDERTSCAQWPWPQTGHRSRLPARGGLVGGVNPGCASGLGGGRPRGRARGLPLRVNFGAFSRTLAALAEMLQILLKLHLQVLLHSYLQ